MSTSLPLPRPLLLQFLANPGLTLAEALPMLVSTALSPREQARLYTYTAMVIGRSCEPPCMATIWRMDRALYREQCHMASVVMAEPRERVWQWDYPRQWVTSSDLLEATGLRHHSRISALVLRHPELAGKTRQSGRRTTRYWNTASIEAWRRAALLETLGEKVEMEQPAPAKRRVRRVESSTVESNTVESNTVESNAAESNSGMKTELPVTPRSTYPWDTLALRSVIEIVHLRMMEHALHRLTFSVSGVTRARYAVWIEEAGDSPVLLRSHEDADRANWYTPEMEAIGRKVQEELQATGVASLVVEPGRPLKATRYVVVEEEAPE